MWFIGVNWAAMWFIVVMYFGGFNFFSHETSRDVFTSHLRAEEEDVLWGVQIKKLRPSEEFLHRDLRHTVA